MGYIYCQRFSHPADPLTSALREELYPAATRYQDIDWDGARHLVADIDNYTPIGAVMRTAHNMLAHYERAGGIRSLRRRGLAFGALCRRTCFGVSLTVVVPQLLSTSTRRTSRPTISTSGP